MKARPILMHARSIANLLGGRKTQTRRILKTQPLDVLPMNEPGKWTGLMQREPEPKGNVFHCRYGVPGDLLWVRETFRPMHSGDPSRGARYRADPGEHWHPWKPGIHMPRWASRITLRLTDVRCERVQSISEVDALAEGCLALAMTMGDVQLGSQKARASFATLWDDTNGSGAWNRNDWTWALSFEVLRENVDAVLGRAKVAA